MASFNLKSEWEPAGDQPKAIEALTKGLNSDIEHQTLLGVTGSGKTFTIANVIANVNKPTLVIAHNKTLAAQLAQEYKEFFPENEVHYFVSYYDYYQPEAYLAASDTYIEKDAQINEEIDRLRHASTQALLTRRDVIIVASVSCIYGIGSPEEYRKQHLELNVGDKLERRSLIAKLVQVFFERTPSDLTPGTFRAIGNRVEIMPVSERVIYRVDLGVGKIKSIEKIDAITRAIIDTPNTLFLFPAKHFLTPEDERKRAITAIKNELADRLKVLKKEGKLLEAERLRRRTNYDLAMIKEVGYCNGIENYSRHLAGREEGDPPDTLLAYFPHTKDGKPDFLTVIDESHVTIPQVGGMHAGDASRKKSLIEFGFRLPSALDNRPLQFKEFEERVGQVIYTSATPGEYEMEKSKGHVAEQIIRPTGLVDPELEVRPIVSKGKFKGQVPDFIEEAKAVVKKGYRVLATTLTKKMAEDLSAYLKEQKLRSEYLHSEIKTIDRIRILTEFRKGAFDCLVGVNLLREGLDLPEVALIGILDADKEGFLRSETSLIQTIGRAARNATGRVILYADQMTGSMERAIGETNRRRALQLAYNKEHGITPKTIEKKIHDITEQFEKAHDKAVRANIETDLPIFKKNPDRLLRQKEKQMNAAAKILDFETAAILRDEIRLLQESLAKGVGQPDKKTKKAKGK